MQQPPQLQVFDVNATDKEVQLIQKLTLLSWKAYIKDLPVNGTAAIETPSKQPTDDTTL